MALWPGWQRSTPQACGRWDESGFGCGLKSWVGSQGLASAREGAQGARQRASGIEGLLPGVGIPIGREGCHQAGECLLRLGVTG
jgi:hypothetical protein